MISRALQFIVGREPVAYTAGLAGLTIAMLGVAAAFGANITETQIAAIGTLATAVAGWLGRSAVTPVLGKRDERGSVPLALIILIVAGVLVVGALFATCDALVDDEDEPGDLGSPALILDHDGWDGGSDGNEGYDGEGGRSGDTDQNGDENCRNLCGNTIIVPDPRR